MPVEWFDKVGITTAPLSQFRLFFRILVTDHDDWNRTQLGVLFYFAATFVATFLGQSKTHVDQVRPLAANYGMHFWTVLCFENLSGSLLQKLAFDCPEKHRVIGQENA